MIACEINKNSFEYQTLKNMSGISEYSLDSYISTFQTKFNRMPKLDELPRVNSEPYLEKVLGIKKLSNIRTINTNRLLEYTGTNSVEEANIKLNSIYKDLEVTLTPFQSFTSIEIKHRPSMYTSIKEPLNIEEFKQDGVTILSKQLDKMQKLYGINIIPVSNDEIQELGIPNGSQIKGFVKNGNIYINIENSTMDTKVHELMHIFLGGIRYSNPELYFSLVNQVEQLPRYQEFSVRFPNRTRGDINEEIFVQEFANYLTKAPSIFDNFGDINELMYEIYRNIDTLIDGNYSVKSLQTSAFGNTLEELYKNLQSENVVNKQTGSLDDSTLHRTLANVKEKLMEKNLLEERCDG